MGVPYGDHPKTPSPDRVRLRASLVMEEAIEFLEACFGANAYTGALRAQADVVINACAVHIDLVEAVDALADIDYVVEGSRLEFGIDGGPIAAEVHRANMAKVGGPVREDGKRLKPPGWTPPDIAGELRKQGWRG